MFLLDNNWWGESADNGIKLDLGERVIKPLKDEGGEIALNDRTPNALCVGATGAGKSVLINHILSGLISNYPPSALSMVLVDFKDVEFQCFADRSTRLSRIPHASLLAGTKDGSFAIPILSALNQELEERTELFVKAGCGRLTSTTTGCARWVWMSVACRVSWLYSTSSKCPSQPPRSA